MNLGAGNNDDGYLDEPRPVHDELARQFMQHLDMKQTADYLMRGRWLRALDVQQLTELWVAAVNVAAEAAKANAERCEAQTVLGDTMAEFSMRNIEPPLDKVEEQLEVVWSEVARWGMGSALEDELHRFMEGRDKPH